MSLPPRIGLAALRGSLRLQIRSTSAAPHPSRLLHSIPRSSTNTPSAPLRISSHPLFLRTFASSTPTLSESQTARTRDQSWEEKERRGRARRNLPQLKTTWPYYVLAGIAGVGFWVVFLLHATNAERLSSSVLRQITYQLRNDEKVHEVLGERVKYADNWWGFGEPWISGTINIMQGRVDLKFRAQGTKQAGTVYFTSIRPAENTEFQIVRYKVNADDGQVINLNPNQS